MYTFFEPLEYQKKLKVSKKYWKNTKQESCTKKVQFCTRRRKSLFLTHPVCTGVFINVDFLISPSFIKKSQFSPKRMEDKIGTFHYYENLQNVKREICKNCKINFWLELLGFLNNPWAKDNSWEICIPDSKRYYASWRWKFHRQSQNLLSR